MLNNSNNFHQLYFPSILCYMYVFWGLKLLCHKKDDFNLLIANSQKISIDKMQAACKQGRILSCMLQIFVHLVCLTKGSLSKVMLSVKEKRSGGAVDWPFILGCFVYILDSSNSSSFTFWSNQFAFSSRSNWTGIWTCNSIFTWTDKQSSHFSTAKEIRVKATFFFM